GLSAASIVTVQWTPAALSSGVRSSGLKGTPKRLERGIACVRQYVHPGRLIGTVTPEVLKCIDDETHRMPPMALRMLPQSPDRPLRPVCAENPILIGDGDRAANGHVAAAPLSSVMNSRRLN